MIGMRRPPIVRLLQLFRGNKHDQDHDGVADVWLCSMVSAAIVSCVVFHGVVSDEMIDMTTHRRPTEGSQKPTKREEAKRRRQA